MNASMLFLCRSKAYVFYFRNLLGTDTENRVLNERDI